MRRQFLFFLLRWILSSLSLWVAIQLLGTNYSSSYPLQTAWTVALAGLILSLVNVVLRPIITILSLPVILLTFGLFTVVLNGLMIYISLALTPGVSMTFTNSIIASLLLSLVNYVIGSISSLTVNAQKRSSTI